MPLPRNFCCDASGIDETEPPSSATINSRHSAGSRASRASHCGFSRKCALALLFDKSKRSRAAEFLRPMTSSKTLLCALAATVLGAGSSFCAQVIVPDSDEAHADARFERSARAMPASRSDEDRQIGLSRRRTVAEDNDRAASRTVLPKHYRRGQVTPIEVDR